MILFLDPITRVTFIIDKSKEWKFFRMQSISIWYQTPEQFSFLKNFVGTPGFDFVKTTSDLVDVLVTGDKVESFKQLLNEKNMDYTVMIEDIEEIVTEEYITQEVERRLKSRIQDYASGRLSFTYYPKYNEASERENFKRFKQKNFFLFFLKNISSFKKKLIRNISVEITGERILGLFDEGVQ